MISRAYDRRAKRFISPPRIRPLVFAGFSVSSRRRASPDDAVDFAPFRGRRTALNHSTVARANHSEMAPRGAGSARNGPGVNAAGRIDQSNSVSLDRRAALVAVAIGAAFGPGHRRSVEAPGGRQKINNALTNRSHILLFFRTRRQTPPPAMSRRDRGVFYAGADKALASPRKNRKISYDALTGGTPPSFSRLQFVDDRVDPRRLCW